MTKGTTHTRTAGHSHLALPFWKNYGAFSILPFLMKQGTSIHRRTGIPNRTTSVWTWNEKYCFLNRRNAGSAVYDQWPERQQSSAIISTPARATCGTTRSSWARCRAPCGEHLFFLKKNHGLIAISSLFAIAEAKFPSRCEEYWRVEDRRLSALRNENECKIKSRSIWIIPKNQHEAICIRRAVSHQKRPIRLPESKRNYNNKQIWQVSLVTEAGFEDEKLLRGKFNHL